ncbi:hypothetical protein BCR43DRAFT_239059 [Syncephalastrum racemosum]|uniref:WD40-repeat-containing domain protein n=1 Tax=Syncephalastrum racemosum TaxID=13706 RepID=A0A1X2HEQ2_SYNRA|nr:hypothetical protein BCR43DRAFT_239059 [Syncephalastrum racemosum]
MRRYRPFTIYSNQKSAEDNIRANTHIHTYIPFFPSCKYIQTTMSSSISLPLVVWHNFVNPHTTCLVSHYPYVYAGQKDGQIWAYAITDNNLSLQHRFLLVGHKAPVVALTIIPSEKSSASSESFLISAAEDGEIARWSAADGRCLAVNPKGFFGVPHDLKYFDKFSKRHLFCSGQTNEICILNATTLEVRSDA